METRGGRGILWVGKYFAKKAFIRFINELIIAVAYLT